MPVLFACRLYRFIQSLPGLGNVSLMKLLAPSFWSRGFAAAVLESWF